MALTYISLFFLLVIQVISQQNYYEILGVTRNANEQQMRKQFKKLSLKYHPDKNKGKESQKIYQEIVNAYEVLKDPDLRQIYDQFGEQGLKEGKQQQQRQNFNNQFRQGDNGGINYFFQTDVIILNFENISKFYRRREVWLVFFHKSTRKESQNYKDTIRDIASKYYGIFKVSAIDCIEEEELCDDFSVYEQPLIKVYPSNINQEGIQYVGNQDSNRIAALAIKQMESFSQVITEQNYDDFISSYQNIPKVFLFTQKKSTSPLFMALSKEFIGRLKFGEIRNTQVNLIQKFKIQQFPTLMVLTNASLYQGIFYEGVLKKDQLMKFLRSNTNKELVTDQQSSSKPIKMTYSLSQNDANCGISDSNFCFLVIHTLDQQKDVLNVLNDLSKKYTDSPIRFFYVEKSIIENGNIFEDEDVYNELPSVYILKGKRMKYIPYKEQFQISPLIQFIESVLGGGGNQKKMHDFLNRNVFQNLKYDL